MSGSLLNPIGTLFLKTRKSIKMINKSDAVVAYAGVYFDKDNNGIRIDSHTRGLKGETQVFYFKNEENGNTFWCKAEEVTHFGKTEPAHVIGRVTSDEFTMICRVIEITKKVMKMEQAVVA
jgi:hypothetical protein